MNESGIWTGILNNKLGTFKFINVNLLANYSNSNSSLNTLQAQSSVNMKFENNTNLIRTGTAEAVKKRRLPKSSTFNSILKKSIGQINADGDYRLTLSGKKYFIFKCLISIIKLKAFNIIIIILIHLLFLRLFILRIRKKVKSIKKKNPS